MREMRPASFKLIDALVPTTGMRDPSSTRMFGGRFDTAVRAALISVAVLLSSCATISPRSALPQANANQTELDGFNNVRFWGDESGATIGAAISGNTSGLPSGAQPVSELRRRISNLLAISGGAEDGAFGAGLLVGWSEAGSRPNFDLVTGVSSGALTAPFAFLGRERDGQLREIFTKYGRKDIFAYNVPSLLEGSALVDDSPLAKLIAKYVDLQFLQEIARERTKGRILLIGTTNLDAQRPVLWDMGRIAMSENPEALALFRKVLLASATLPGVFPPVRIKVRSGGQDYDELHVDGGLTRQVFITSVFSSRVQSRPRLYVIRNGRINPEWQAVNENLFSITQRSLSTLIKNQGIGDLYRIYSIAKQDGIDFNLASIPADFSESTGQPFDLTYMNSLFERGYVMGSQHQPWAKAPPGLDAATQQSKLAR
jgi:predicted acylesterase/phospholipase RssA